MGALTVNTAPTAEPITVAEAKEHLRVTHSDEDAYIESLIHAARVHCETFTRRQLMSATLKYELDGFPDQIVLPSPPLTSVSSIKHYDPSGTQQTVTASDYRVDSSSEPGRVEPAYGKVWPPTRSIINTVEIIYVCGYTNAAAVPDGLKAAIKLMVAHLYENREVIITGTIIAKVPMAIDSLLWQHRALEF